MRTPASRECGRLLVGIAVAVLSSLAVPTPALHAQRPAPLEPREPWSERWFSHIPVTGGLRVGVMAATAEPSLDPRVFHVRMPVMDQPWLCVEVNSRDGRYKANLRYDVRGVAAGPLRLRLPTVHRRRLSTYSADELVILAALGSACGGEVETYLLASWREMRTTESIHVFVNSRVPTYLVAAEDGKAKHDVRCQDLPGSTIAFNLVCSIRTAWVTPTARLFVRKRERQGRRSFFADVPLPLR